MKLYIKNMVCSRCIYIVQQEFLKHGIKAHVDLGEAETDQELTKEQLTGLSGALQQFGFELIDNKRKRLIEQIRHLVIGQVNSFAALPVNYSSFLADKLKQDYNYLSALFSSVEGITIEKFVIQTRIEKVKELLVYDELTLSEIADKLHYSSVAHLSNQFKKVTGLSPSQFKHFSSHKRIPLDQI